MPITDFGQWVATGWEFVKDGVGARVHGVGSRAQGDASLTWP